MSSSSMVEDHHNSRRAWIVCFTAALFFFYEFIQMNMFNTISQDLMRDFAINATQLGYLSAIYFYADVVFLPVAGTLLDRFSARKIILITLLLCVVSIATFATTHNLLVAKYARFFSGIGGAFCFLSSIRLASRWFPAQRMAFVTGLIVTMAMTGGMVAQTPLIFLVEKLGWRHALLVDAALGLIIMVAIYFVVHDYPQSMKWSKQDRSQISEMGLLRCWFQAYFNYQNWLGAIYTSLMNLPLVLLGAIWGGLYLVQVQHLTRLQASYVNTMLFVGSIVGGPIAGWISDKIQRRRLPMIAGMLMSLVVIMAIIYIPHLSLNAYLVLYFLLGLLISTQIISYPLVAENSPRALTATSVSVVSFCAVGGYAIFQPFFGWLMDWHWKGLIVDNVRVYPAESYYYAFMIIPIGFVFALIAAFLVRESYCKTLDDIDETNTLTNIYPSVEQ